MFLGIFPATTSLRIDMDLYEGAKSTIRAEHGYKICDIKIVKKIITWQQCYWIKNITLACAIVALTIEELYNEKNHVIIRVSLVLLFEYYC